MNRRVISSILLTLCLMLLSCGYPVPEGGEYLNGLPPAARHVTALALDKDGVLWMGLAYRGIVAYRDNKFQVFDRMNTEMPDSSITEIFVDRNNVKWFGSLNGFVFTFDNKRWEFLPNPEEAKLIKTISQDSDGTIWVAGRYGGVWSYKDKKIDKHFTKELAIKELGYAIVAGLAIDSNDTLWIGTKTKEIYKFDGQKWEKISTGLPKDSVMRGISIRDIFYSSSDNTTYITTDYGLYIYQSGKPEILTSENSGLAFSNVDLVRVDSRGHLWIGYGNQYQGVSRFDGTNWAQFNESTPLHGAWVNDIVSDENGRVWFGFTDRKSGLAMLDGDIWTTYPVLGSDPRIWWRQKGLDELFKRGVLSADVNEVLKSPLQYRGKKIEILGKIESGFEYANMVDRDGNRLNIWPEYHPELEHLLKDTGISTEIAKSAYKQYVGYLEFEGYYGHLGGWPFQLFIVEIYPYTSDKQQKETYKKIYEAYLRTRPHAPSLEFPKPIRSEPIPEPPAAKPPSQ